MQSIPLSFGELWLLYVSIYLENCHMPKGWILDGDQTRETGYNAHLNMPANGMTVPEFAENLLRLRDRGHIEIITQEDFERDSPRIPLEISDIALVCQVICEETDARRLISLGAGPYPFRVFYQLTPEGIAAWEAYAQPNWERYRGESRGNVQEWVCETIWSQQAQSESFARALLTNDAMNPSCPSLIHWDSEFVASHNSWEPLPGKTLLGGVTLYVRVTELGRFEFEAEDYARVRPLCDEYYREFGELCRWYDVWLGDHPDCPKRTRA